MRVLFKGDLSVEVEFTGSEIVSRSKRAGDVVNETRAPCSNSLRARWEIDRLCAEQVRAGFELDATADRGGELTLAGFERALDEAPDDVESYAVYADWLSERGDAWGEVMAVQAALAALPRFGKGARRDELDRLSTRLLFEHGQALWGRLGEIVLAEATQVYACDCVDATWFCGFIRAASIRHLAGARRLPLAEIVSLFAGLRVAVRLGSLSVAAEVLDESLLAEIAGRTWPHLDALVLAAESPDGVRATFEAAALAAAFADEATPRLASVVVTGARDAETILSALSRRTSPVRSIRIHRSTFGPQAVSLAQQAARAGLDELVLTGEGLPTSAQSELRMVAKRVVVASG